MITQICIVPILKINIKGKNEHYYFISILKKIQANQSHFYLCQSLSVLLN